MLLSLVFKGLVVGPMRKVFKPVREIGVDLGGDWKWCGACKANDGRLFFLPRNAPEFKILVFDPAFGTTKFLEFPRERRIKGHFALTGQKYNGAVLGMDGCIYGIPACALHVVRIDPNLNRVEFVGSPKRGSWKWGQGCLAPNGFIYGAPCNENTILSIDTNVGEHSKPVTFIRLFDHVLKPKDNQSSSSFISTNSKWWGAVCVPESALNGMSHDAVYFTPKSANRVLKLVVSTKDSGEMSLVGDTLLNGGEKFLGATFANGYVVSCPANRGGRKVLLFDPLNDTTNLVGPDLSSAHFKWHDAVKGADGRVWGIPHHADKALVLDLKLAEASINGAKEALLELQRGSISGSVGTVADGDSEALKQAENNGVVEMFGSSLGADGGRYGCGALADDGFIYAAPMFARRILRIDTLDVADTRKFLKVGSQIHYYGDDDGEGSMLWLWRSYPEIWFMGLCHPIYGVEFLEWFKKESSGTFKDDTKEESINDLSTLSLEKQCGISMRIKDKELSLDGTSTGGGGRNYSTLGNIDDDIDENNENNEDEGNGSELSTMNALHSDNINNGRGEGGDKPFIFASQFKNLGLYKASSIRISRITNLVDRILDVPESLRKKLIQVPLLQSAFISPDTVGPWILKRLIKYTNRTAQTRGALKVLEYFKLVSELPGYQALALPWANVISLDQSTDETMEQGTQGGTTGGGGSGLDTMFSIDDADDDEGEEEEEGINALEVEKEVLTFGNHVAGYGWGWKWWERNGISLEWQEWKELVKKKHGGRLLTLREAREILEYKTLCPGEDRWVAVLQDMQGRRISRKGKIKFDVSTHTYYSSRRSNDRQVEDWVQVGDLSCPPGTSLQSMPQLRQELLKRSKFTEGDWAEKKEFARTEPSVCMWKPMGRAEQGPLLLQAVLGVKDEEVRLKLMQTKLMHRILLRNETVGKWIVEGLAGRLGKRNGIVCYMVEASSVDKEDILTEAFASLPNLFPAMLQLPALTQEAAVSTPLFTKVMDMKLAERPAAVAIVCTDIVLVALLLGLYLASCGDIHELYTSIPSVKLTFVTLLNLYFFLRELYQMKTMTSLGMSEEYWTNWWNINDMLGSICTYIAVGIAGGSDVDVRTGSFYKAFAAITSVFLWLKLLSTIKVLNIKLATFVYSLNLILRDLSEFVLVMSIVLLMFSFMFTMINADGSSEGLDFNLSDLRPFHSPSYSIMSCYMMIMGLLERDWFEVDGAAGLTALSVALFFIFMFFVVIVMLNVLIAVVSDSYDFAMTKAKQLFLRTRLVLVAELDSLGIADEDFLPPWADKHLLRLGRLPGIRYITDALHVKTESAAGKNADEWTGRVLHMEHLTNNIVNKRVTSGVDTIIEQLKAQESRILDVEKRIARRIAQQEITRKQEKDDETQKVNQSASTQRHNQFMKEQALQRKFDDLARKQQESEQRILQALKAKP